MDPQAELLSPTGPVMLRALLRQTEARVAKLEPYLTRTDTHGLYADLSLLAIKLDTIEQRIVVSEEYREAQLAPIVIPLDHARRVIDSPAERWRRMKRQGG